IITSASEVRPAAAPLTTAPISAATCSGPKYPSAIAITTSPDSLNAAARESAITRPRATSFGSISRCVGTQAPTDITQAPSATQSFHTNGVADAVTIATASRSEEQRLN